MMKEIYQNEPNTYSNKLKLIQENQKFV